MMQLAAQQFNRRCQLDTRLWSMVTYSAYLQHGTLEPGCGSNKNLSYF
jgi:hypothetical protein